ncbi:MAG: AAA family ATPase, partial [Nitrosarchaeum sp.]|nr:AAA family ATPase [Nitrosarchaeum sp.]
MALHQQMEPQRNDIDEDGILQRLESIRQEHKTQSIGLNDLLIVLFDVDQLLQNFLQQQNIDRDDLIAICSWAEAKKQYQKLHHFWTKEQQFRRRPLGLEWAYGYTPTLKKFAQDINYQFEGTNQSVWLVGREDSINQLERVLSRLGQNNVLLIGSPGVGKRTLVYGLAQRIAQGKSIPELSHRRIFELDMGAIRSSGAGNQQIEGILRSVLHDANESGNIILFINDFQNSIGVSDATGIGILDVSSVLQPYLDSSNIHIIASITQEGYHHLLENRPGMLKIFEPIEIIEPSSINTVRILQTLVPSIEYNERIFITHQGLKAIVLKSEMFIQDKPFPEKSIDLLNEVVAYIHTQDKKILTKEDVDRVVSQKTNIPLGALQEGEKDKIQHLDELLHEHIVNQQQAITQLSRTVLRLRAGITNTSKPAGSFLFIGPTGVGKTLTAETLAQVYYG